ncbi:hypothetical protein C7447_102258 [Tenacibaculum adriaticum]|uniref:Uncharacterized protein n=1 Tax=Tenacibaculum adriaticum TaxID=413713 RepID=A0A5S5DSM9_9FLAO|nr:hypothetical protein [Tenacibaculum adriaticum]TYP98940.1 hypothetical protein C7447_102258 [Tenacibaculum adriaticum]
MKKILLPVYRKSEKHSSLPYYILFDIGKRLEFTSKRKAEDFARSLNVYLSDSVRTLMLVQRELYAIYLDYYFELESISSLRLQKKLDGFLSDLEYFHKEYGEGNNSFKMGGYWRILNHVEETLDLSLTLFKEKNNYTIVNKLRSHKQMVSFSYDKINQSITSHVINDDYKKTKFKVLTTKTTFYQSL